MRMSTKEQDFKERLAAALSDLNEAGSKDAEAVWLIGSLSARLVDIYKLKSWRAFKQQLTAPAYNQLLKDFETEGNSYHNAGKARAAYAIQMLAMSVVCRTQRDPQVREGEALLDQMIDRMLTAYRKASAAEAAKAT
jgi:hypothetical protein